MQMTHRLRLTVYSPDNPQSLLRHVECHIDLPQVIQQSQQQLSTAEVWSVTTDKARVKLYLQQHAVPGSAHCVKLQPTAHLEGVEAYLRPTVVAAVTMCLYSDVVVEQQQSIRART